MNTRWDQAEWRGDAVTYGRRLTEVKGRLLEPVMVWHTTETSGVPGYRGGTVAPTFTAYVKERRWIQHAKIGEVVGTLSGWSSSGGPTNHANVVAQCEIVAYSAWWLAGLPGRVAVRDLDEQDLAWLASLPRFLSEEGWLPAEHAWSPGWTGTSQIRELTWHEWLYGRAWTQTGHASVPDLSKHWDPGGLDRDRLIALSNSGTGPTGWGDEETMKLGNQGKRVRWAQHRLNIHADAGLGSGGLKVDGEYGPRTEQAVKDWQAEFPHLDEDGILTALDIDRLRRRPNAV